MLPDINEAAEGMRRRMLVKRLNAIRDIERWAVEGTDISTDSFNTTGQIKENVTEGRLLKSRLVDISKERHRFLTSHNYQKVKFKESREESSEIARQLRSQHKIGYGEKTNEETGTKWLLHEQLNIDVSDEKDDRPQENKPQTVKELRFGRSKTFHGFPQEKQNGKASIGVTMGRRTVTSQSIQHDKLPEIKHDKKNTTTTVHFDEDEMREKKNRRVLRDSRYSKFTDLLCPVFITDCPFDIDTIVQNTESLRNPASMDETSRTHLLFKIKDYIKLRGYTF